MAKEDYINERVIDIAKYMVKIIHYETSAKVHGVDVPQCLEIYIIGYKKLNRIFILKY